MASRWEPSLLPIHGSGFLNVGKDVGKKEASYTAGGNVN
jgi:hypothetical protein